MINVADVLSWVEIVGWGLIFWGFLTILGIIGGIGKFLDKLPGLSGLGGDGGGSTDLSPVIDRIDKLEQGVNKRFTDVDTSLANLTAEIGLIKQMITEIRAIIENMIQVIAAWEARFEQINNYLKEIKLKIEAGVSLSDEERKKIEDMLIQNLAAFKASLEQVEQRLTEKLSELDKKLEEIAKEIKDIHTELTEGFKQITSLEEEIKKINETISKLPEQIRVQLHAELSVIIPELEAIKKQMAELLAENSEAHKKILEKIAGIKGGKISDKKLRELIKKILKILDEQIKGAHGGPNIYFGGNFAIGQGSIAQGSNAVGGNLKEILEGLAALSIDAEAGRSVTFRQRANKIGAETKAVEGRIKAVADKTKTGAGDKNKVTEEMLKELDKEKQYIEWEWDSAKKLPNIASSISRAITNLNQTKDAGKRKAFEKIIQNETDDFKKILRKEYRRGRREYSRANTHKLFDYINSHTEQAFRQWAGNKMQKMNVFEADSIKLYQEILPRLIESHGTGALTPGKSRQGGSGIVYGNWNKAKEESDNLIKIYQGWIVEINSLAKEIKSPTLR